MLGNVAGKPCVRQTDAATSSRLSGGDKAPWCAWVCVRVCRPLCARRRLLVQDTQTRSTTACSRFSQRLGARATRFSWIHAYLETGLMYGSVRAKTTASHAPVAPMQRESWAIRPLAMTAHVGGRCEHVGGIIAEAMNSHMTVPAGQERAHHPCTARSRVATVEFTE